MTSSNLTIASSCPAPFLDASAYPREGDLSLRLCTDLPGNGGSCCVPCPQWEYMYPDNFSTIAKIPGYISIVSLALCIFMLIGYTLLPQQITKRQHLNTSLIIAIVLLQLGLMIPSLAQPEQCLDAITPNDMKSSMTCAWSGALVVFGGCAGMTWVLARVVSMHLLICWDVKATRLFFWGSQLFAWGVAIVLTTVCLAITGVSFRFGDYCQVNNYKGVQTLWAPLLGLAAVSVVVQLATFIYCLKVYIQSLFDDRASTYASGQSNHGSADRTQTARAVYKRIRSVLALQWRSICITLFVLIVVIYLSAVFVDLNERFQTVADNIDTALPWISCMVMQKDKNACLEYAAPLRPGDATVAATLYLLSIMGIAAFFLIGNFGLITGWGTAIREWREGKGTFDDNDSARRDLVGRGKTLSIPFGGKGKKYPIAISQPIVISSPVSSAFGSPSTVCTSPSSGFKSSHNSWGSYDEKSQQLPPRPISKLLPIIPHHNLASIDEQVERDAEKRVTITEETEV